MRVRFMTFAWIGIGLAIAGCVGSRFKLAPASASAPTPALAGAEFAPLAAEFDTEG